MDTLSGIEFFTSSVDAGSFAAAARRLGVTASAVSRRVAQLEDELGVTLMARTTRTLALTDDGRAFHQRCVRILEELREAREAIARASTVPAGVVRVDAPVALGRFVLAPRVPELLARYPELRLELTVRDQMVDAITEGADVLVRVGPPGDSALIARKLSTTALVACASPAYLRRRGTPRNPADLTRHDVIGFLRDGSPRPWSFVTGGRSYQVEVSGRYHANDASLLRAAAVAGQGIALQFDFLVADALASGELVQVLAAHAPPPRPIHALYPRNRHLLPKVRVFLDFLSELFDRPPPAPRRRRARR